MLLLNMFKVFELSGLFVCPGGQKKLQGCGLLGGISTQANTLVSFSQALNLVGKIWMIFSQGKIRKP